MSGKKLFGRVLRSASAASKAHKLGDLIDEACDARVAYEGADASSRMPEADKVAIELNRMLDGFRALSPVTIKKNAHKLVNVVKHAHMSVRRYYGLSDESQTPEASDLAHKVDRLVCLMAGLDPDKVSVRDFEV